MSLLSTNQILLGKDIAPASKTSPATENPSVTHRITSQTLNPELCGRSTTDFSGQGCPYSGWRQSCTTWDLGSQKNPKVLQFLGYRPCSVVQTFLRPQQDPFGWRKECMGSKVYGQVSGLLQEAGFPSSPSHLVAPRRCWKWERGHVETPHFSALNSEAKPYTPNPKPQTRNPEV